MSLPPRPAGHHSSPCAFTVVYTRGVNDCRHLFTMHKRVGFPRYLDIFSLLKLWLYCYFQEGSPSPAPVPILYVTINKLGLCGTEITN